MLCARNSVEILEHIKVVKTLFRFTSSCALGYERLFQSAYARFYEYHLKKSLSLSTILNRSLCVCTIVAAVSCYCLVASVSVYKTNF